MILPVGAGFTGSWPASGSGCFLLNYIIWGGNFSALPAGGENPGGWGERRSFRYNKVKHFKAQRNPAGRNGMISIGIDLGTTNTKAIALSEDGRILCEMSQPTEVRKVLSGGEMDPKALAADLFDLLRKMLDEIRGLTDEPVSAIGLTGMAEAGFLADLRDEPLTPILLWYDQRGAAEAEELRAAHERELTGISGIRMSGVATIYKLCYLRKQLPQLSGKRMRWIGVPEWAARLLTAGHFTDRTLAVRTGSYSLKTADWSPRVFELTGLDGALFPEIIPALEQDVPVSPEVAEHLGIPGTTRVFVAGHDDLAAAYGAGLRPGCWVDSTGTAEGLTALTAPCPPPEQTVPPCAVCARPLIPFPFAAPS